MKKSQLKAGIYLSYISLFLTNVTNLVITPFIVRNLGDSEYGLYMLIGSIVGYTAVLDFGLGNTTTRFVSKYRAQKDRVKEENFLFSTFIIYGIISIIVLIIGIIIYYNLPYIFKNSLSPHEIYTAKIMFIILVVNLAFTLPMNSLIGIIKAYERFIFPRILTIGRVIIRITLIFILLSLGYKAIAIVVVDAILNLLMLVLSMMYVFIKLKVKIKLHYFNLKLYQEILSYSFWIFISVIVDQLYWRIGQLILGIYASTTDVAIFAIGIMLGQYFMNFSTAISGVFLPRVTKMVTKDASNEELTDIMIRVGRIQFIVLGLILSGFILVGNDFLYLWLGDNYSDSWKIGLVVMIPLMFVLTQTIGITILQAKNLHKFRAISYLIIAIVNTLISIYFVKKLGAIGAAVGTSLSLIIGNIIVMNLYYHIKVKLNMIRFYKEVSKGLLIAFIFATIIGSLLSKMTIENWLSLGIQIIVYTAIYSIVMWFVGFNKGEKKLFLGEFNKIIKYFKIIR